VTSLRDALPGNGMVDILALVLHHVMPKAGFQHDEQAVPVAVEMALAEGVATKTHVLNLLHRLIDGKIMAAPTSTAPFSGIFNALPGNGTVHVHMHGRGYATIADPSARTRGQCRTP